MGTLLRMERRGSLVETPWDADVARLVALGLPVTDAEALAAELTYQQELGQTSRQSRRS